MTATGSLSVYIVPYEIRETLPEEKPESREGERRILDCSFRNTEALRGGMLVSTVQERIAELAGRNPEWSLSTLNQYLTEDWLKIAYNELNKHSVTGIDGVSVKEYGINIDAKLTELVGKAKTGLYRAHLLSGGVTYLRIRRKSVR